VGVELTARARCSYEIQIKGARKVIPEKPLLSEIAEAAVYLSRAR
jgi:hypothetical protein